MACRAEVYQRQNTNLWGWRLIADNGQIIATDGGQGYSNESDAQQMARRVKDGEWKSCPVVDA